MKEAIVLIEEVLEHLPDKEVEGSWDNINARLLRQVITILCDRQLEVA